MAFGWLSALHPRSKQIIHRIEDLYGVRRAYIYRTWSKLTPERRAALSQVPAPLHSVADATADPRPRSGSAFDHFRFSDLEKTRFAGRLRSTLPTPTSPFPSKLSC